jgi:predicted lipoprotein with Yx(FWY)xxD motif
MRRALTLAAAASALAFAGCGGDSGSSDSSDAAAEPATSGTETGASAPPKAAPSGTTVKVASSDFGGILYDGQDQAIYLFDKETGSTPDCYGDCAEAWPPVLTKGEPRAGKGAKAALLGTARRSDGTIQVTYNGHPLYYYVHDGKKEVRCNDVEEFGGLWLVVTPAGDAVQV